MNQDRIDIEEEIPEVNEDDFFEGADALNNLKKLKNLASDAEEIMEKTKKMVNTFNDAGNELSGLIKDIRSRFTEKEETNGEE